MRDVVLVLNTHGRSGRLLAGSVVLTPSATEASQLNSSAQYMRIESPFEHPVDLLDAAQITEVDGFEVVAYRIENSEVAGEYSLGGGQTPAEYRSYFSDRFGTVPEIVAAITLQPSATTEQDISRTPVEVAAPELDAPLVPSDAPAVQDQTAAAARASDSEAAERSALIAPPAGLAWAPDTADLQIWDNGSTIYFGHYYQWTGPDGYPYDLPDHWGMEFGIDVYTDDPILGTRPFCSMGGSDAQDYKHRPFAKNFGYSWVVYSSKIGSQSMSPINNALLGAYADYNDAEDACNRNSITIGLANPWDLEYDTSGAVRLSIDIVAPQGLDTKGFIEGAVQAVSRGMCEDYSWMSLTDCMGVYDEATNPGTGPSKLSRATLSAARYWKGPDLAWVSNDYGTVPPLAY